MESSARKNLLLDIKTSLTLSQVLFYMKPIYVPLTLCYLSSIVRRSCELTINFDELNNFSVGLIVRFYSNMLLFNPKIKLFVKVKYATDSTGIRYYEQNNTKHLFCFLFNRII